MLSFLRALIAALAAPFFFLLLLCLGALDFVLTAWHGPDEPASGPGRDEPKEGGGS